jgi:hypothetical protein
MAAILVPVVVEAVLETVVAVAVVAVAQGIQ